MATPSLDLICSQVQNWLNPGWRRWELLELGEAPE